MFAAAELRLLSSEGVQVGILTDKDLNVLLRQRVAMEDETGQGWLGARAAEGR